MKSWLDTIFISCESPMTHTEKYINREPKQLSVLHTLNLGLKLYEANNFAGYLQSNVLNENQVRSHNDVNNRLVLSKQSC